jgi:hypothetical protein
MAIAKLSIDLETRLATFERDLNRMSSLADGAARRMQGAFKGVTVMFAGLAGALSVGAIKSAFDSYVQGAAAMDDLAEIVGSTTEKVSALANVAKVSGTDLGLLEGGMVKLAKAVTTVEDETGSLGSAFAALNLDPKEMKLLDTSDQLKVLAERLNEYEDGASKTAIATALLGKSGAQLLPYLKDLATTGDLVSKVTSEQAAAAEEYEKNLKRLAIVNSEVARIFSAEVVPAANALVKTFIDVMNGSDGVRGSVKGLAEDGSVRNWAVDSVRAIGFVIDAFDGVARVAQVVGKTIGGAAAQASALASGDLKGYKAIGAEWRADIENVVQVPLFSQQLEKNISAMKALGTAAVDTKKKLNFSAAIPSAKGGRGKGGGTADRAASFQDYDQQLMQKIASAIEKTDVVKAAELVRELEKLDQLAAAGLDPAIVKAVRDDLTGATKEAADETARLNSLLSATPTDKLQASRDDMLLLTKALTEGRIAEEQYLEAVTARLDGMSEKTKEAVSEMDEFTKAAAKNIENTLADFLYDPFSEGLDGMVKKFADVLRKMAADALAAKIAKSMFGDMGASGGGDSGWVGAALKAVTVAAGYHQGGIVGANDHSFTRAVPAAMFSGARRYHGGGLAGDEVPAILQKGERVLTKEQQRGMGSAPAPSQNIRIVNAFDNSVIGDYMGSAAGEKVIMNAVQRNAGAFRAAMA